MDRDEQGDEERDQARALSFRYHADVRALVSRVRVEPTQP